MCPDEDPCKPVLDMVGNAHLDPVWLWPWQEGYQETWATFRSALDRMNEFPDFVFTCSSAAYYAWIEDADPAMFEEIRRRVAERRWVPVGGWWIQPDCLHPSGESFARQALYGQRYFRSRFGRICRTGYNVDSFGHNAMLPQLLKLSGLTQYTFMRPGPHEKTLPAWKFRWRSADGSQLPAYRIPNSYGSGADDLDAHVAACAAQAGPQGRMMCFYGVGNHGGGPTIANIRSIRRLNESIDGPELRFSDPDTFFDAVRGGVATWPEVHGELLHHASGCYAAHSEIKRLNRKAEYRLVAAEKWSAVAFLDNGRTIPVDDLSRAWQSVLFNQFHDILAGTSLESAYDDARESYGEALNRAASTLNVAVQSISRRIRVDVETGVRPLVVFNSLGHALTRMVEIEAGRIKPDTRLIDDRGRECAYQLIPSEATAMGRCRLLFEADLPAFGYRLFRLVEPSDSDKASAASTPAERNTRLVYGEHYAANRHLRVDFSPHGAMNSLRVWQPDDSGWSDNLLAAPGAQPMVCQDPGDTWAHGIRRFDDVIGSFEAASLRLTESGPLRVVWRSEWRYGQSRLVQDYVLDRDRPELTVRVSLDWCEQRKVLKLRFPTVLRVSQSFAGTAYGQAGREPDGEEYPFQGWIRLIGAIPGAEPRNGSLTLISDSRTSYDLNGGDLGLTGVRSPIYAHHDPVQPDPETDYRYLDQGMQRFNYQVVPSVSRGNVSGNNSEISSLALQMLEQPIALFETFHPGGTLSGSGSWLSIDRPEIQFSALKRGEDGGGMILRLHNAASQAVRCSVWLRAPERTISAGFGPLQLRTWFLPDDPAKPVRAVNLIEDDLLESDSRDGLC